MKRLTVASLTTQQARDLRAGEIFQVGEEVAEKVTRNHMKIGCSPSSVPVRFFDHYDVQTNEWRVCVKFRPTILDMMQHMIIHRLKKKIMPASGKKIA